MMVELRLCNVLLSDGTRSDEYRDLYIKTTSGAGIQRDGATLLSDAASLRHDFATYFNSFSNIKWHRYTVIDEVWLRIVAKGTFEVAYTAYEATLGEPKRVVLGRQTVEAADFQTIDYCYPASSAAFFAFEITSIGETSVKEAYYFTKIDEDEIRDVELAVATTTFRKEAYVIPNIEQFKTQILGCDEDIADHFTLHVIDNGRTLDVDELEADRVHIHPNPNVGGAGGFSRGMIEAMEQVPEATHVILMDDDVQVSPESVKRTYNLLRVVRDEYARAFISGAMLCMEKPAQFKEDIGYIGQAATYGAAKTRPFEEGPFNMTSMHDMVRLETIDPYVQNLYAAWWYCVIPVALIHEHGLGLPIFIRGDDAEYGNRVAEGFMTMCGICIWHQLSSGVFKAAMERYYPIRNSFIAQSASNIYQNIDFLPSLHYQIGVDLKTFNYDAAETCLMALEDYLKGPDYLKRLNTERFNMQLSQLNEKILPLDELIARLPAGVEFNANDLEDEKDRSITDRLFDFLTFNGQRGPALLARGGVAVIVYSGWNYPANVIRGVDTIVAICEDGSGGVIRHKDCARFKSQLKRYNQLLKEFHERRDELNELWSSARDELTSVEFWKRYLEEQAQ